MKILVVNSGSSSVKYQAFDMAAHQVLASGLVERIGQPMGRIVHAVRPGSAIEKKIENEQPFPDHAAGLRAAIALLEDKTDGVIESAAEIGAVGHRVVHGGEHFSAPAVITEKVVQAIRDTIPLAPLHNPPNLMGIETAMALFPKAAQVAVFDTAFHQTMPQKAFLYALPYELYEKRHIRRYGFHGTSHGYVANRAAAFLGKPLESCDLVTLHLGNGCSAAAIKNGKSVDTSMGMTPLAGLIMGTRCGDLDPQAALFLAMQENMPVDEIDAMLNKKSGLLGICGASDMRDIHARRQGGDERARLAFEMFCYSIRKYLGAYLAALGRADAVVFTAGIGEHDAFAREEAVKGLDGLGLAVDPEKNAAPGGGEREISRADSPVKILVIPTNEELEIARQTMQALAG